ncbi:MAG: peptide ABC transporter substrate-binding protein [Ktedonobacteraceae bacterium]
MCIICLCACIVSACGGPAVSQDHSLLTGRYSYIPSVNHAPTGTLVIADHDFPTAVNPLFAATRADLELSAALWAAPVVFDEHFHAQADQLTEVPLPENGGVQDGGKTIIMHLRHNLRWSDGQPLLASDFAYWWQLDQDPNTGAIATAGYDQIASITTPDNFTVILHLRQPFGPYLSYLPYAAPEHAWGHIQALDLQNHPEIFQAPTVTDGPYKLALFVDKQSYILTPNSYYTSTTFHGPFLAQLTYRAYSTDGALATALRTGQVDVAEGYTEDDLATLGPLLAPLRVQTSSAAAYEHLDFNLAQPFFQDLKVRQAMQLALDRCGILRNILHTSDCTRLLDQVEPQPSLVYDPSLHLPGYDPGKARSLLAAAGWLPAANGLVYKQGQPLVVRLVTTTGDALRAAVARSLQENLRAVGIQVQLTFYNLSTFFGVYTRGGILATGAYDLALFGYANSPEPDDEYAVFHSSQIPDAAHPDLGNYGRIADPIIDQSLADCRTMEPFAARQQAYQHFLARLVQEVYIIPLYTAVNVLIVKNNLRNIIGNPDTVKNNWNIADWWIAT